MPEHEQQNPFEDHINSEAFDIERLDKVFPQTDMDLDIERFFNELPYPLNHELWDTELDERQKLICAHLVTELVDRVLRVYHEDLLEDFNDAQLLDILTAPVTIALLAQQRLYKTETKQVEPKILIPPPLEKETIESSPAPFLEKMKHWFNQFQVFVLRIFRRG